MADPQLLTTLRAKRDDLDALLRTQRAHVAATEKAIAHVAAVIHLYEVGDEIPQYPIHMDLARLFRRGEQIKLAQEAIREAGKPLTTREIADHVLRAKGWDLEDRPLRTSVTYRLVQSLANAERKGVVRRCGKRGNVCVWAA